MSNEKKIYFIRQMTKPGIIVDPLGLIQATDEDLKELGFVKVQDVIDWLDFRVGDFSIGEFKKKFESSFGDKDG